VIMKSMLPINPALAHLPVYQPGRPIEEVARELNLPAQDIIKLASNENPLGPSPMALAAMEKALHQLHLYPDGNAFYLKRKLADKLGVEPANLILGNGSNEIIEFAGHALMAPGTDVVVSQYCFLVYPIMARLFGANLISVPARNYGHDLPAMLQAVTPKTRVMFVANPNNPTGTMVGQGELDQFVGLVSPSVVIAIDEAYYEFLPNPPDSLKYIRDHPNIIMLRTFSKIQGLAGLRIGYGLAHPDLIRLLQKTRQPFNVNSIAQAGALAGLQDEAHQAKTRQVTREGRDFLQAGFARRNLEYIPSVANFVLVKVGSGKEVFQKLLRRGVIVRAMDEYKLPEWIRVSVGTPEQNRRFFEDLDAVL